MRVRLEIKVTSFLQVREKGSEGNGQRSDR